MGADSSKTFIDQQQEEHFNLVIIIMIILQLRDLTINDCSKSEHQAPTLSWQLIVIFL